MATARCDQGDARRERESVMVEAFELGELTEPLTGKHWDRAAVVDRCRRRLGFYAPYRLTAGDRVFIHYGNTPEFFADLAALWALGACVVPIDPRLTRFEVETLARAATPRLSLWRGAVNSDLAAALSRAGAEVVDATAADDAPPADLAARPFALDQDALILFTSGTTGQPKGVVHTHGSLRAQWEGLRRALGLDAYRRTLCLLPTHFGHGLICNCLFPWLFGQHLFILPPFRPDLIIGLGSLLDEFRVTFMSSVPTVWRLVLKTGKPPRTPALERVSCGSAPLSAALWRQIQEWTGAREVWNAYGITETASWLAGTSMPDFTPEDGLIGAPWGGVIKILPTSQPRAPMTTAAECAPGDNGYVWVKTPALMRGYFGRDDLTAQVVSDGWFLTGDIGCVDDRGWLYLRGREREEINKGGMKVYPADIDGVVERFDRAVDACAFAISDPLLGEDIGLAVVLESTDAATLRRLYDWMARHLAAHQMPRRWYLVEHIERTARGKLNRAQVATQCAGLEPVNIRCILRENA
jgi:acyl-CoA synthetase (AMP-forming)/AMP-acid ligase II